MYGMHLIQALFTYSACGPSTKKNPKKTKNSNLKKHAIQDKCIKTN